MATINAHYITDKNGEKISVVIPYAEFQEILEKLDELEDVKLYDEAKSDNAPFILADKAFKLIGSKRNKK